MDSFVINTIVISLNHPVGLKITKIRGTKMDPYGIPRTSATC